MPKKQKENGFSLYMKDMRRKLESEGRKFQNLGELIGICSPLWNKFSDEEKAAYNRRAKNTEVKQERCDTRGMPIAFKEREERMKQETKMKNDQEIEKLIHDLSLDGTLVDQAFHFGHFNYIVATDEKQYPPCELAIIKYSLVSGIKKQFCYHEFVDPGPIPKGYSYEAKVHSEETHRIPSYGFKLYNNDYISITNAIKSNLSEDGSIAPLYVLDSEIPQAEYVLDWLITQSVNSDSKYPQHNPFKVRSINKLLYEIRRHADLNNPRLAFTSTSQVADALTSGKFDHCPNMACQWHEEADCTKFCSLTRVRGYAYEISDLCCEHFDLSLLPNFHCPAEIADETKYEIQPKIAKREDESVSSVQTTPSTKEEFKTGEPRKPQSHGIVGSRVAANFGSVGRGLLGSSFGSVTPVPGSPSTSVSDSPMPGRGRGRGLLAHWND